MGLADLAIVQRPAEYTKKQKAVNSQPIWHPSPGTGAAHFRQSLVVSGKVEEAAFRCAGCGPYEVYVNGRLAGRGLGAVVAQEAMWEHFALGPFLGSGENHLLVFALGQVGKGRAWFRAEGEIVYADGQRAQPGTGPWWRARPADNWREYDNGRVSGVCFGAHVPGEHSEEGWEAAAVVPGPEPLEWNPLPAIEEEVWAGQVVVFGEVESAGELRFIEEPDPLQACKCVRREALLVPGKSQALVQTRLSERAVYLVLDFGRVRCGFPRLRLRGQEGAVIDLGFARRWGALEGGLRYACGAGRREWTSPRLETCRYLVARLSHCAEGMEIDCLSLVERRVETGMQGAFAAEGKLEESWAVGQRSLEDCRREVYWLAPTRVRYDWLKFYVLALNDFYLTGTGETAAAVLDSGRPPRPKEDGMSQTLARALFAESYYRHWGDRERIERVLPALLEGLEACGPCSDEGPATATMALYAGALEAAARLCRSLRQKERAASCEREARQARKVLQRAWKEERGLFADEAGGEASQWANGLVLYLGLAGEEQQGRMGAQLVQGHGRRVDDLWQAFFVAGGLWQAGADQGALAYVEQQWGCLLEREGETWAEKAEAAEAVPGPEYFLGARVLGIGPQAPGYQVLEVAPQPSGLGGAQGEVMTPRGSVEVEWSMGSEGVFALVVGVEGDGETHLAVPRLGRRFPTLTINGETVWRNEKVHPNAHVREVISEARRVVLVLRKEGQYEVVVE
jgi:hypothetical protein